MARKPWCIVALACALVGGPAADRILGGQAASRPTPWTLDEASQQMILHPDDPYLQYVALQLGHNEGKQNEVAEQLRQLNRRWQSQPDRNASLFALFSAAHAIQETLQMDAMQGEGAGLVGEMGVRAKETVKVATLRGPEVKSHPWGKMLAAQSVAGKRPEVSRLALCVPDDQYFVRFGSVEKLLQVVELGDRWGAHMFTQTIGNATTSLTSSRLKTQLAIQTDPITRPFYDMVVEEIAITGSDLYFRAGSDTTVLFAVKQPQVFQLRMDGFLDAAEKSRPGAVRTTGNVLGVPYVSVSTPDRSICVFSAYPKPDLHVRSNSGAALERVVAAILGKTGDGKPVRRLGETTEYKYIRTLMPLGAKEEDGLIYLSDPFIRRIVGPELKLTSQRRMLCYNHLRMIGHGAMLFQTQTGRAPKSLEELASGGCAPGLFGQGKYRCPDGGRYALAGDGVTAACSHHGCAESLTPCCEIALGSATPQEAAQYQDFVARYSQYWRRFFDPIAIRVQVTPEQYRVETIILPLIDNSLYTGLAQSLGGEPEPLDALPVPDRNVFSVAARFNKPEEAREVLRAKLAGATIFGNRLPRPVTEDDADLLLRFLYDGIGNQVGMHVYDASPMFDFNLTEFLGEMVRNFRGGRGAIDDDIYPVSFLVASLNAPVYVALPVRDAELVDRTLERLDVYLAEIARSRDERGWLDLEMDFYRSPLSGTSPPVRCYSIAFGPVKWRVFFARVGGGLYLASKRFILEDLERLEQSRAKAKASGRQADEGPVAHAMIRIRPEHWKEILPAFRLGWAEASREACLNNLGPLSSVARLALSAEGGVKAEEILRRADAAHAVHFFCPDGGRYELAPGGREIVCTAHGSASMPRQGIAPSEKSPMGKLLKEFGGLTMGLTFLEDGLHAVVTVERK